jgi:hypothetical protein
MNSRAARGDFPTMNVALLLCVLLSQVEPSSPPLVPSPPSTPVVEQAPTAPPARDSGAGFELRVLATATVNWPLALTGTSFLIGGRAELDLWRAHAWLTWDREGTTPFSLSSADAFTGGVGYSLLDVGGAKLRLLGGLAVQASTENPTRLGPVLGVSARVGVSVLAVDASATLVPFGLPQLDARLGVALHLGPTELQVGYRVRYVDATGTVGTLFQTTPFAGPTVALGVSL